MLTTTLPIPCPQCGETGHTLNFSGDDLSVECPQLPKNVFLWLMPDGTIVRDNRGSFRTKSEPVEFPEFSDALDFFDANDVIEV